MNRDFIGALLQLNAEKGVPQEILIHTLEQAIESAYRRNADAPENVVVTVNPETGEISVAREYDVVAGKTTTHSAGPGWDFPTGWGAPNAARLIEVLP